ncbi:MAG: hypothetical protein AB8F95_14615 [Bacteroidia bacterium]
MTLERLVLILGGLLCIGGFFLPYIDVSLATVSGFDMTMAGVEAAQDMDAPPGPVMRTLGEEWAAAENFADLGKIFGAIIFVLGPFFFAIYGLSYLFKGLTGKAYKRGIFFTILFTLGAWIFFYFVGPELGMLWGKNVFKLVGLGFWLSFAGMWVAAFSLFFSKNI